MQTFRVEGQQLGAAQTEAMVSVATCCRTSKATALTNIAGSGGQSHISVEHTAPHRRGGANHNDHRPHPTGGGGDKARNDDITADKRQQPYHTSVENTTGPTPQGRGRGQTRPDGESNKAKQNNYPLDRQGGIPWGGVWRGGVAAPAPPPPPKDPRFFVLHSLFVSFPSHRKVTEPNRTAETEPPETEPP